MKTSVSIVVVVILLLVPGPMWGDELTDLKAQAEQIQQMLNGLKSRISDLEKQREGAASSPSHQPATNPIEPNKMADSKQMLTAPPPSAPAYPGYIPIPDTSLLVRLNFKPRVGCHRG